MGRLGGSFTADRKTRLFEVVAKLDHGDGIENP